MTALTQRSMFLPVIGMLTSLAWLTLWAWEASPYGRYLDHGDWTKIGLTGALCRAIPAGEIIVPAMLYVLGWLLMLVAMMLPTTLPLLEIYRRLIRRHGDRHVLIGLVILGYLGAWGGFGLAAHVLDLGIYFVVSNDPWLSFNGWAIGATVLVLAGAFQFSRLKYACLDKCRMPLGFVMEHWGRPGKKRQALRMGFRHGLFCVGCCWALMLLMFVVGTGSVGWMLLLGAVMAVEKNMPWGPRISRPLGVLLIAGGMLIVTQHSLASVP